MTPPRIHPTAIVEPGVDIGDGTAVWDNVHLRGPSTIGRDCIVGEKTYIAYDVVIGDLCKLNANVYVCAGVTIEAGVMVAAHTVFTNDLLPRATDPDVQALQTSVEKEWDDKKAEEAAALVEVSIGPATRTSPSASL